MTSLSAQPDLFGEVPLPGLSQADAIVTPSEERSLIAAIDAADLSPFRFHGWFGKQLTVSYGWGYDFDDASLAPSQPIPDWLPSYSLRCARRVLINDDMLSGCCLARILATILHPVGPVWTFRTGASNPIWRPRLAICTA